MLSTCLDNIGFRQFADHQQDRRFGVGHPGVAHVLHRIRDGGDIPQSHCGAILVVDDQRLIVGGGLQLIVEFCTCQRCALSSSAPCGLRTLASLMAVRTASSDTPWLNNACGVEVDAHRRQGAAADVDITHAVDLRDGLRQLGGGEIIQLTLGVGVRGQRPGS